jgi:hypothetical protein
MVLVSDKGQKYQIKEVSENLEKFGNVADNAVCQKVLTTRGVRVD